ncbi:serine/threonine protein kinase [Ectothiorhodospiraceae bacterium 2226]|nr:serine/threonine protein kinase [Ectothiorhodospiraceae bacterium 2226]
MNAPAHPYDALTPDRVLDAVEALGLRPDGRLLALNSYENRVYQIGIEDDRFVVAKFYRPARWDDAAILEEHAYALALAEAEIPVVAPLMLEGRTLHHDGPFRYAVFPRRGGRAPSLDNPEHLTWLGRFLGRIHLLGAARRFEHRPRVSPADGRSALAYLLAEAVPDALAHNYRAAAEPLLDAVEAAFERVGPYRTLRLHGDCHAGNVLWTDAGPHFVDLDDCRNGPAVQDLWMLLSGTREEMEGQLRALLEGYREFYDFDPLELHLVEALRALRLITYSAWLARRWDDPAFPMHFPWFHTARYWEDQLQTLREQRERLAEPPLAL